MKIFIRLCAVKLRPSGRGGCQSARLTNKGADFLLDDGGLSAILGTITIKFHEDTIKSILSTKIESSSLPKEEKSSLLNILKGLSGKALERVITKLVDLGFENAV
ncbi:hypothetical protein, partial [Avibacterium paragallinarum]|uniref:hypothetical protein n=1 Tax=Avibacterium paragallinarum TaxID=728 RepID=UPI000D4D50B8